jgi:uncharacterized phiE125 gp8 family phage protein
MGNYKLILPPTGNVITVSEAKQHLNLATAETFWDAYILTLIGVAEDMVQQKTWRALLPQQWLFTQDADEVQDVIYFTKCPLVSVDTVKYINASGDLVDATGYTVDLTSEPARIKFDSDPQVKAGALNALQVEFTAGYSFTFSASVTVDSVNVSNDTFTEADHGLKNNDVIEFSEVGTITGISTDTPYYVISRTTNTFKISLTVGGDAIDLGGTDDTKPIYAIKSTENIPMSIKQAIKLIVGDYFMHREDSEYGRSYEIPNSVNNILQPYTLTFFFHAKI